MPINHIPINHIEPKRTEVKHTELKRTKVNMTPHDKLNNEGEKMEPKNKYAKYIAGAALAADGIYAAKKIHDKKKKDKENNKDIKENYEYDEYNTLIESIIYSLSNEELFMEDCNEFVHSVADYMIENS